MDLPEKHRTSSDAQPEAARVKTEELQSAIFKSVNFFYIATEKGVIQLFNAGAERMLGYTALKVVNKITPAEISDPRELIARAEVLSLEFARHAAPYTCPNSQRRADSQGRLVSA